MGVGASGALVDVSAYADLQAGVTRGWGRQTEFEDIAPGTFSFILDNAGGQFTPGNTTGNTAAGFSTTVTEGMAVCWNLDGRLVAGTIQSIEPLFPSDEAAWAQVRITCDDMLGNAGRRQLTNLLDSIIDGASPLLMWELNDAVGSIVPASTVAVGAGLLTLSGANGSAFGAAAVTGLTTDTQLSLKDTLTPTAAWPTFTFTYPTTSLGFYSFWVTPESTSKITAAVSLSGFARTLQFGFNAGNYFVRDGDSGTTANYALSGSDPHFVTMGVSSAFAASVWTVTLTLYVDGTSRGTVTYADTFTSLPYRAPLGVTLMAS